MDYLDYMLWKLAGMAFLAFCWGLYCGITGRPLGREQRDSQAAERQGSPANEK